MSGSLSGHGGAGGITARYDDLLAAAALLDEEADMLRDRGGDAAGVAVHGSVLEAALLCPSEVVSVEGDAAQAGVLPGSATWLGAELEAFAKVVTFSVEAYREVDQMLADLDDAVHQTGGRLLGTTLGVGLLTSPLGMLLLGGAAYLGREELMELLHDNPWLLESLLESAPDLVQGLALTLLGPAAMTGSDGLWPTSDYEEAVLGLQAFAQKFGLLHDSGDFHFSRNAELESYPMPDLQSMVDAEWLYAYHQNAAGEHVPRIVVMPITKDGVTSYVVHVPGTQVWDPRRGENPYDLTSNITLMGQEAEARIAAEVTRIVNDLDGEVMLIGHSQGGMIAAAVAASDRVEEGRVTGLLTMGSPVATFDVPDSVQTLSLENAHDAVPMLDGADNPDVPHWTTITHEDASTDIGDAHSGEHYSQAAAAIDSGQLTGHVADSMEEWREQNGHFFGLTDAVHIYELDDPEDTP